jgi:hypothetical protein
MSTPIFTGKGLTQLTGINRGYSISSLDDMFNEIESIQPAERLVEHPTDSLAISCKNFRIRQAINKYPNAYEISDVDRQMANDIRDYYSKKLMVRTLKGKTMSKFRQDLSTYLTNGYTTRYPEKYEGMIYRLPEFYAYDQEIDKLRMESNNTEQQTGIGIRTLTPVKKLASTNKSGTVFHYWFHDSKKHLYKMYVNKDNELQPLFDSVFEKDELVVNARFAPHTQDDLHFSNIKNFKLLNL